MTFVRAQTVRRLALTLGSAAAFLSISLPGETVAPTQAPPPYYFNRNVIVLDPAHGGQDNGGSVNGQLEKNITLELGISLRDALTARGFTVVSTRDSDLTEAAPLLLTDQRAGIANHLRPAACVILHATNRGSGVHIFTSSLVASAEPSVSSAPSATLPWDSAQALYLPQSLRLANAVGSALVHARLPALLAQTGLRPLDNLTCPAIAIEIAPLSSSDAKSTPATDAGYQRRIVESVAAAMLAWRDLNAPRPASSVPIPTQMPKPMPPPGATP